MADSNWELLCNVWTFKYAIFCLRPPAGRKMGYSCISITVRARDFKFGTHMVLGERTIFA